MYAKEGEIMNSNENKKDVGFLLGFFLGMLGLIIGLLLYPYKTKERETFLKGWITAFIVQIVCVFVVLIIYLIVVFAIII